MVIIWVLFGLLFPWLFYKIKLTTEIRAEGVFVKFSPFQFRFKHFSYPDIRDCQSITYRPIADYGGYGIRYGRKGKAYNISGNRGILLTFRNDKTLMIGSQKAEELSNAIHQRLNR